MSRDSERIVFLEGQAERMRQRESEEAQALGVQNLRFQAALEMARVGQEDGAHHKTWVIDQMVRALTGSDYEAWVLAYEDMDDGFDDGAYHWDTGIAP